MLTQLQKEQVLKYIDSLTSRGFTSRDIARLIDLDSDDRRSLQRFLDELDSEGIIHRVRRGRYSIPARENLVTGILSCHRDGYGFLVPDDRNRYKEDIFIPARNMEDAMHGDRVLVKVAARSYRPKKFFRGRRIREFRDEKERLEGTVIRVLERKHAQIVGRFRSHPRFPYVVPLDNRIIHNIRIPYHWSKDAKDGEIVAVSMTLPPGRNQEAQGKVIEILGHPGDPGIEYRIVEHKFGLPVEFSPEALREAESLPDRILANEYANREDFRDDVVVTIDGENARDFDDAVGLRKLPSGNFLLAVHIADVSHYVREGTAIDAEAYARGTSVYFPDRAIPMLPPKLSSEICSLVPGEDRLVLSALIEIDPKGRLVGKRFVQGVLCSRARMTYTSVAKILIDRDPAERTRYADLVPMLEQMEELCLVLSQKRYSRGAVDFDLPEAEMQFDDAGKVISVLPAQRNVAHRIIEEFMLMANECVAQLLSDSGGPALYRVHEAPDPTKVEEFAEFARNLGYKLETRKDAYRPRDFQQFVLQLEGKPEQRFLIYQMLRSFMQAHYSERNVGHFGLAVREYTHFTSPIRRYPDLIVHRIVKECLKKNPSPEWRQAMGSRLAEFARHTSARERTADEAEREIENIKKAQFMADKLGEEFEAIVFGVSRQGLFVELLEHFVEGFVPVENLPPDDYRYNEDSRSLTGRRLRQSFRLGVKTRVRLIRVDLENARLTFSMAR